MIAALVVALLAAAAAVYVLGPLGRAGREDEPDQRDARDEASAKKRSALNAIVELEHEHEMGKLSDADFRELAQEYETEAVAALRELDAAVEAPEDEALEAEIASMRQRLRCPSCGAVRPPGGSCSRCGE